MVAQDPYTGTVYTVSAAGLYQTTNQGESWTKVSGGAGSGVTSLAFGRHGAYACGSLGLVLLQRDGSEVPVGAACITVAVDDEWLYAAKSSEGRDELRVEMLRTPIGDGPLGLRDPGLDHADQLRRDRRSPCSRPSAGGIATHTVQIARICSDLPHEHRRALERRISRLMTLLLVGGMCLYAFLAMVIYVILARIEQGFAVFG